VELYGWIPTLWRKLLHPVFRVSDQGTVVSSYTGRLEGLSMGGGKEMKFGPGL